MAYNLLGLRTSVRTKLKDTSYSASTIDEAINDTIQEIADLFEWPYFQRIVEGALTVDEYTFELPSNHQLTKGLTIIEPADLTSGVDITPYHMTPDEFFGVFTTIAAQDSSKPHHWTEYGYQIYFNQPVDKAYILRQTYIKIPDELTADTDVPELPREFREAIMLGAVYRCEEERENYDISGVMQNRFNDRVADLISRHANNTGAPDTVILGSRSSNPWWY